MGSMGAVVALPTGIALQHHSEALLHYETDRCCAAEGPLGLQKLT
jgi:hypothetical protein